MGTYQRGGNMNFMTTTKHVLGVTIFAGVFLYGIHEWCYKRGLEDVKVSLLENNEAVASELASLKGDISPKLKNQKLTRQEARDIQFVIANFVYETLGYNDSEAEQTEAFRVIGTSMINKMHFEGQKNFEQLVTEKTKKKDGRTVCQYSWYCEKGKPVDIAHIKKNYASRFPIAYKMAVEIVLGGFVPVAYSETDRFDGVYYATLDSYRSKDSWHRKEVEAGRQCRRRTIDTHVYTAPNVSGNCKQNQFAYYGNGT